MTDTERLVAFLLDRETERGIAAGEIHNKYDCGSIGPVPMPCDCGEPARVIAESTARRQIINAWPDSLGQWSAQQADAARAMKRDVLLRMARAHSAHPAFDPAWRLDQS